MNKLSVLLILQPYTLSACHMTAYITFSDHIQLHTSPFPITFNCIHQPFQTTFIVRLLYYHKHQPFLLTLQPKKNDTITNVLSALQNFNHWLPNDEYISLFRLPRSPES